MSIPDVLAMPSLGAGNDSVASSGDESTDSQKRKRLHIGEVGDLPSQDPKRMNTQDIMETHSAAMTIASAAPEVEDPRNDPRGAYQVQRNVKLLLNSWGSISPVEPDYFLQRMLESRGYDSSYVHSLSEIM
jgi:hypothetical protein